MTFLLEPIIGEWYRRLSDELLFQVIEIEEDEGLLEILQADGTLAQLDLYAWHDTELEEAEAPENWDEAGHGAMSEDDSSAGATYRDEDWRAPLFEAARHEGPWRDNTLDTWDPEGDDSDESVDRDSTDDPGEAD